jgi:hypothetical protein
MDIKQEDGNNTKDKKMSYVVVWEFTLLQALGILRR